MQIEENLPLLLRRKHVKQILGISDTLYYRMLEEKKLPCIQLNGRMYVHRSEFLKMLKDFREGKKEIW